MAQGRSAGDFVLWVAGGGGRDARGMTHNLAGAPIVAGVDGSESATHAALWAAEEALTRSMPLLLVHAVPVPAGAYAGRFGIDVGFLNGLETQGRDALAQVHAQITRKHPGLTVSTKLFSGDVVGNLIELSREARMVVLGSRGLGQVSGILAGSTAVALVAHGKCPVAVIRDQSPPASGPVVLGVDGTRASATAVELAFEEAAIREVELIAVHTWTEFVSDLTYAYARQFEMDWEQIEQHEQELLSESLAGWQQKYPEVPVRRIVIRDRPVRQLLEHAQHAQLLVVGSRGHGGFAGMLLGSTSQALIYHALCPLLVARSA